MVMIYGLPSTTIPAHAQRVRVSVSALEHGKLCKVYAPSAPGLALVGLIVGQTNPVFGGGVTLEHGLSLDFGTDCPGVIQGFPLIAEFTNHTASAIYLAGFGFVVRSPRDAVPVDDDPREVPCVECKHPERYHSPMFSSDASRFRCTFPGCPCVRVER